MSPRATVICLLTALASLWLRQREVRAGGAKSPSPGPCPPSRRDSNTRALGHDLRRGSKVSGPSHDPRALGRAWRGEAAGVKPALEPSARCASPAGPSHPGAWAQRGRASRVRPTPRLRGSREGGAGSRPLAGRRRSCRPLPPGADGSGVGAAARGGGRPRSPSSLAHCSPRADPPTAPSEETGARGGGRRGAAEDRGLGGAAAQEFSRRTKRPETRAPSLPVRPHPSHRAPVAVTARGRMGDGGGGGEARERRRDVRTQNGVNKTARPRVPRFWSRPRTRTVSP